MVTENQYTIIHILFVPALQANIRRVDCSIQLKIT